MAANFSILAWRIPTDRGSWWTTVHGVIGVGHEGSNLACMQSIKCAIALCIKKYILLLKSTLLLKKKKTHVGYPLSFQ